MTAHRLFDFKGVHPNVITPGKGWPGYVSKKGDYITNFYERCPYAMALSMPTAEDAIAYLWNKRPKDMVMSAHNAETNITKKL